MTRRSIRLLIVYTAALASVVATALLAEYLGKRVAEWFQPTGTAEPDAAVELLE